MARGLILIQHDSTWSFRQTKHLKSYFTLIQHVNACVVSRPICIVNKRNLSFNAVFLKSRLIEALLLQWKHSINIYFTKGYSEKFRLEIHVHPMISVLSLSLPLYFTQKWRLKVAATFPNLYVWSCKATRSLSFLSFFLATDMGKCAGRITPVKYFISNLTLWDFNTYIVVLSKYILLKKKTYSLCSITKSTLTCTLAQNTLIS